MITLATTMTRPTSTAAATHTKYSPKRDYTYLKYQMKTSRYQYVGKRMQSDETIEAIVHGNAADSTKAHMIATKSRIFSIFSAASAPNIAEVSYDDIYGATAVTNDQFTTIYICARTKTYRLTDVNINQAKQFIKFVESRLYARDMLRSVKQESEQPMRYTFTH